jgi:hypothetical protein
MMTSDRKLIRQAKLLANRLECLSADSSYAHQASGLRGAIIRSLAAREETGVFTDSGWLWGLVERGEKILVEAARQIPESD